MLYWFSLRPIAGKFGSVTSRLVDFSGPSAERCLAFGSQGRSLAFSPESGLVSAFSYR